MKINKWIALAVIALLVVVAMGAITYTTFAQGPGTNGDDASESSDNGAALQGQAAITQEEAEAIALTQYPGAKVVSAELENEGGLLLYSFDFDNGVEVEVDANTGVVLLAETEADGESND